MECEYTDCAWYREGPDTQIDALAKLLDLHIKGKHTPIPTHQHQDSVTKLCPRKVSRPQVEKGVMDDDCNFFLDRFAH